MPKRFSFTKTAIEGLPLPEAGKRSSYYDSKIPGLELRVTSNGTKTFNLYRKINGKPDRVQIGRFPAVTVELARKRAEEINGNIAQGKNPAEEKRTLKAELTLQEVFDEFYEKEVKPNHRAWKEEKRKYDGYLSMWGNRRLSTITQDDVKELKRTLKEQKKRNDSGNGEVQANRVLSFLKTIINYARREMKYKGENPCVGVDKYTEQSRARFIQEPELPKFFKAIQEEPNTAFRNFVLVALFTGQRRENVLTMRWDEISMEREEWIIPAEKFKGKRPHVVPLVGPVMQVLKEAKESAANGLTEWVFQSDRTKTHWVEPKTAWARLLTRAELSDLKIHDLRRTLASYMGITGSPDAIIAGMLGHKAGVGDSLFKVTGIYNRYNLSAIREAMTAAAEYILDEAFKTPEEDTPKPDNVIAFRKQG